MKKKVNWKVVKIENWLIMSHKKVDELKRVSEEKVRHYEDEDKVKSREKNVNEKIVGGHFRFGRKSEPMLAIMSILNGKAVSRPG